MVVVTTTLPREHGARTRAPEAPRPTPRRGAHRRWSRDRIWHAADQLPLADVAEPNRVEICAAVQRHRLSTGCKTAGDDELFAHLVALVHVLYAKAHTEGERGRGGSAHFATTYEQIMAALASKFGIWGPAPTKDTPEREEWVAAHRPRLYDWLEILRQGELISHDSRGVRDNAKVWWRTEVTVLGVPVLTPDEISAAKAYAAAFPRRERDRRRRGRLRPYEAIFKAAKPPSKSQKKTKAIATARARYYAKKEAANSGSSGGPLSPTLPPPGATVENPETSTENQTSTSPYSSLDRTGVRRRPRPGNPDSSRRLRRGNSADHSTVQSERGGGTLEPPAGFVSEGRERLSGGLHGSQGRAHGRRRPRGPVSLIERATWVEEGVFMAQALRERSGDIDLSDRTVLEAITRAWYLSRYGEDEMMARLPWCPRFNVAELVEAAELYRRHIAAKLPGLPDCPIGALLRMASTPLPSYQARGRQPDGSWKTFTRYPEQAETIAYAVRGLRLLARDMAAADLLLEDRRPTVSQPELYQRPARNRFGHQRPDVWDEPDLEIRRQRVRDQLTKADGNPRRHDSVESMELELIDRERHGLLPPQFAYPSPTAMRAHRGAWMPAWYVPTPDPLSPVDAWATIVKAADQWLDEGTIGLWLEPLAPIELADGTLTVAGPTTHVQFVTTRLLKILDEIREASGVARRLAVVDLADFAGGRHHTPPRPPASDPGADGKHARARRHLKRMEAERRRLLAERDTRITDTELVARRNSDTRHNQLWDELLDIAATRPEFHSTTVVDLWLRPLLPHFGDDGILTLYGHDPALQAVRRKLGPALTHLIQVSAGGRGIRWHATATEPRRDA